ncbi:hypothetical protein DFH08DRAFT_1077114 [Mycena albidolilacea]|uniref:SnoaL-like domain-containing protein n=1 Tax=Mycena albidolilacea TaxID=1033008 RepID=A0AAD7EW55_9AGAR|nr:hypothetical protein DFH08DRAFT_1077114 [Mycena albidolilacea]
MSDIHSKQLENAHAILKHLIERDWDAVSDLLSPDFKHEVLPAGTIPSTDGKEGRGKEEFLGLVRYIFMVFENITLLPPIDVIQGKDAAVLHFKSDGTSKSGVKYNNEYITIVRFDGEKIVGLKEFVDSKHTTEFFAAVSAG